MGRAGFNRRVFRALGVLLFSAAFSGLSAQTLGTPTQLEFGEVVVDPTGGSITVSPSTGAITATVGVYPTSTLATAASAIVATDKGGRTALVYTTAATFTMSGTGGSFSVSTGPFSTEYPGDTFTFPGTGTTTVTFHVAGTLVIPANQGAGDYNGSLPIFIRDNIGNNTNVVNVPVHIRIVAPIAISKVQDLDLGTVIPGATGGTVTLNPATGVEGTTGGVLYAAGTGLPAQFSVTGTPSQNYAITLGSSSITVTGPSGTMSLSLTTSPGGTGTFSGTGTSTLNVGGTLSVAANQAEGDYLGTFQVTVSYP